MTGPWSSISKLAQVLGTAGLLALFGCSTGGKPSNKPPDLALLRVQPADGQSGVARNTPVILTFNTPVLPQSVDDQSIKIRTGGTFQTRPEGSFLVSGDTVEFDPTVSETGDANSAGFPAGSQVLVEVPLFMPNSNEPKENFLQNVNRDKNGEGRPITTASGDNKVAFTTGSGWNDPVAGPPGVLGLEFIPSPNGVGQVPPNAAVTVVFSEPVDPSTVILGKNIFLTNNTPTSPLFQEGIPSVTYYDGSLTRYTFLPVFGFGTGPYNIKVNFIDPLNPEKFTPANLPTDLGGNRVQNFTFVGTFDTEFDPNVINTGLITEDFTSVLHRDNSPGQTDAIWGDDAEVPFALVDQPITTRVADVNLTAIHNISGGSTAIDNPPLGTFGEEDYCPTVNPLVGGNLILSSFNPPLSDGRRRMNLYRTAEIGPSGTVIRAAWGPDSDALFAATYSHVIVRMGHHKKDTDLGPGSFFANYDIDGYVVVADAQNYRVIQAANIGGASTTDGYYDWPKFDRFFDYDGKDDVILDVEATEGTTWQQFRTFIAVDATFGVCTCTNPAGCAVNNSIGMRQGDTIFGSDDANPASIAGSPNPGPFVDVMEFELAKLVSQGTSLYYDTNVDSPNYLTPIVLPLVQPGGAVATLYWSGSSDGIMEDVPFNTNIDAVDGHRYIRWRAVLRSNLFTGARARLQILQIAYTFK